jgi:hypothetical protein
VDGEGAGAAAIVVVGVGEVLLACSEARVTDGAAGVVVAEVVGNKAA